ncbi:putative zinc finger protein [Eutypa lata UCREL1]|uniref:Putative zinc finger protein n=1 Tax=Eutypa lata (strain UCR-EL1) TaxID=1287681 RepID=M7T2I7_EUTLA|nr:putative zinc finger protein [Eutypa lata UCREL1]
MIITGNMSRNGGDAKCSICQTRFATAQEFYEHLDDCVLNVIVPSTTPKPPKEQASTPQRNDEGPTTTGVLEADGNTKVDEKQNMEVAASSNKTDQNGVDKMELDE